jgi:hypothetical protein
MASPQGTFNDPYSISGLFNDPAQANSLAANPMFNMGMGVLSSAYDPNVNPFGAAMGGLNKATAEGRSQDEESRDEDLRKALAEFFARQGGGGGGMPGQDRAAQFGQIPGQNGPPGREYGAASGQQMPGQSEPGRDYYSYGWGDILNGGS